MLFFPTVVVASLSALVAAQVAPSEPGPGDSYNQGEDCNIVWGGDANSQTAWKDMAIQLMTGSNLQMVHITTVATGQDGTVAGSFKYPCPAVTPNSAIYFYQFTAPGALGAKQWTTRFTIASSTGATTPPTEKTQPNSLGVIESIPWGTGALVDPSTAVAPPAFASGSASASGSGAGALPGSTAGATASGSSSTGLPTAGATGLSNTAGATNRLSTTLSRTATTGLPTTTSGLSANGTGAVNGTGGNGAMSMVAASMDSRVLKGGVLAVIVALSMSVL